MTPSLKTSTDTDKSCVLCGRSTFKTWKVVDQVPIVLCEGCRLSFVHPQPTLVERESQYAQDKTSPADYYERTTAADRETFAKRLRVIERYNTPGRLLEVGCTIGTFMQEAKRRGWDPVGVEPNPAACRSARSAGLEVVEGFFSEQMLERMGRNFDLVHMGDVIEHVEDPLETVKLAARSLKRGGLLSIVTPDFGSAVARKFQVKPFEHLFYFTEETLSKTLEKGGFRIELLVRTTRRRDIKSILHGTTKLSPLLQLVVNGTAAVKLDGFFSWFCAQIIRDELFAIGRLP